MMRSASTRSITAMLMAKQWCVQGVLGPSPRCWWQNNGAFKEYSVHHHDVDGKTMVRSTSTRSITTMLMGKQWCVQLVLGPSPRCWWQNNGAFNEYSVHHHDVDGKTMVRSASTRSITTMLMAKQWRVPTCRMQGARSYCWAIHIWSICPFMNRCLFSTPIRNGHWESFLSPVFFWLIAVER